MFKVPDWGNDIPKGDVEVVKLFTKQGKKKTSKGNDHTKTQNNTASKQSNHKKKITNAIHKAKHKMNGHEKLTKDDYIKKRILQRNLKIDIAEEKNHKKSEKKNSKVLLKGDKFLKNNDVNNKIKNKIMKRKGKFNKNENNLNNNSKQVNLVQQNPKSLKRKQNDRSNNIEVNNVDIQSLNSDKPDEILVNAKKKKLNDTIKNDDVEDDLFGNHNTDKHTDVTISRKEKIIQKKKQKLKEILEKNSNRNVIKSSGDKLRERMLERLKAAQFRYINEKLYTASGSESQELFKSDPAAFQTYHEGYQQQVKKWPVNPLDLIVKRIEKMPKSHAIADMGCGEAALAARVPQRVRSFDLVAGAPGVEPCDMAHTPLLAASVDVVVYCLSLMGTDLTQYLLEANRVLKIGGHLLIAEVESRFDSVQSFCDAVQRLGFAAKRQDTSQQVFLLLEFTKAREAPVKRHKLPTLTLKPCLYKRR